MRIAGVVLAAGASSRMGQDKALLEIDGTPFLDRMTGALARGGCEPVMAVIAGTPARYRARCSLAGVELVINPDPARGQSSSLRCALEAAGSVDALVVTLVDQGWIRARTVATVRLALGEQPLAVARFRGQPGHPAGFAASLFAELRSDEVDRSGARLVVDGALAAGRLAWVDVDDPGVVRNLNTPDAYRQALAGIVPAG